jgi:hypothetical protein
MFVVCKWKFELTILYALVVQYLQYPKGFDTPSPPPKKSRIAANYILNFEIPLKSVVKLKIGLAHSLMSLPALSLFSLVSLGCLQRYITALPIPDCFSVPWSSGGN